MSSTEANKIIVRRYRQEIMNEGNLNVVDELFPDKFAVNGQEMSPETFKSLAVMWRTAFPDMCYTLGQIIAVDDMVVEHWTAEAHIAVDSLALLQQASPTRLWESTYIT